MVLLRATLMWLGWQRPVGLDSGSTAGGRGGVHVHMCVCKNALWMCAFIHIVVNYM